MSESNSSSNGDPRDETSVARPDANESGAQSSPVRVGDVLGGKYHVERMIAKGGMGVVVAARHLQLEERVAIKFLREELLGDGDIVARFAREARTAIKIKSEHVARVIDVGSLDSGLPYMVMEYLEGEDVAEWLRSRGPLPLGQAVEFMLQTCEAIAEAHALGIVHRDLKPANLFVMRRADGLFAVKVLDFGISKVTTRGLSTHTAGLTGKSMALGSPSYMSPEQLAFGSTVDPRADVWALGITLFEMLTGAMPFHADTTPHLCGQILRDPPPPLRQLVPDAPQAVEAIINKCLEKDRERRFQNVGELALALSEFAPERARASAQRVVRTVRAAGLGGDIPPDSERTALAAQPATPRKSTRVAWDQVTEVALPKRRRMFAFVTVGTVATAILAVLVRIGFPSATDAAQPRIRQLDTPSPASATPVPEPSPPIVASAAPPASAPLIAAPQPAPRPAAKAASNAGSAPAKTSPRATPSVTATGKPTAAPRNGRPSVYDDRT
ncbi:MAG TPA: serine/threonine-protein kinase [Polyangiaceae bacterium]